VVIRTTHININHLVFTRCFLQEHLAQNQEVGLLVCKYLKRMVVKRGFEPPTPAMKIASVYAAFSWDVKRHDVAQAFQTMDQVAGEMVLVKVAVSIL
jgi:hypothetical protein